jgi:hypothetical protein
MKAHEVGTNPTNAKDDHGKQTNESEKPNEIELHLPFYNPSNETITKTMYR